VKRREENANEPIWEPGFHHFVVITGVRGEVPTDGVELEVIDPWRGRRSVIYLHRDPHGQPFRALKGNLETGEWLDGKPFLQVLAPDIPSLRQRDLEWSERMIIVANFLVGRFCGTGA
jgi:hypothetical protein